MKQIVSFALAIAFLLVILGLTWTNPQAIADTNPQAISESNDKSFFESFVDFLRYGPQPRNGPSDDGAPGPNGPGAGGVPDSSTQASQNPPACNDNQDNDRDGTIDYPEDPGCTSPNDNFESQGNLVCDNFNDDDGLGDGDRYFAFGDLSNHDYGCESPGDPSEYLGTACDDGFDNDGDGFIDYPNDPNCDDIFDESESSEAESFCNDGLDNDGDGLIDYPEDPGCNSLNDPYESQYSLACDNAVDDDELGDGTRYQVDDGSNSKDFGCESPLDSSEYLGTACDDGLDNDGDGFIDYPEDPDCDDIYGTDESNGQELDCMVNQIHEPVVNVQEVGVEEAAQIIKDNNGGTLCFKPGVYELHAGPGQNTEFFFEFITGGLTFAGEGDESIIKLVDIGNYPQVRPIKIYDSNDIIIKDLKIDGNRQAFQDNNQEHQNNVFLRRVTDFKMMNVFSTEARGDSINIADVENVEIINNRFGPNDRNGLTMGGGHVENITISENYFDGRTDTQLIDQEHGTSNNLKIFNNYFGPLTPIDFVYNDQFVIAVSNSTNMHMYNNQLNNPIVIRFSKNILFENNENISQITIDFTNEDITFRENTINAVTTWRNMNQNFGAIVVKRKAYLGVPGFIDDIVFEENVITVNDVPKAFYVENAEDFDALSNTITTDANTESAFHLKVSATDMYATIDQNIISGPQTDIILQEVGGYNIFLDGDH